MKIKSHPSPNFNERPTGMNIDTVVVHATVFETVDEVIHHFASPETNVWPITPSTVTGLSFRMCLNKIAPGTPGNPG